MKSKFNTGDKITHVDYPEWLLQVIQIVDDRYVLKRLIPYPDVYRIYKKQFSIPITAVDCYYKLASKEMSKSA